MEYQGIAAASGYALGTAFLLQEQELQMEKKNLSPKAVVSEVERFEEALHQAVREIEDIQETTRQKLGEDKAAIFAAHILVLSDPEYAGAIKEKIRTEAINAKSAVQAVTEQFLNLFAEIDNEYIRERTADLRDVSQRLLKRLLG